MKDTLTETAPARIWLQVDAGASGDYRDVPFPPNMDGEVTWHHESLGGLEVGYVRADIADYRELYGPNKRNLAFVREWHARAVALGYDGVADMLDSVERGEPPQHITEVMADAAEPRCACPKDHRGQHIYVCDTHGSPTAV